MVLFSVHGGLRQRPWLGHRFSGILNDISRSVVGSEGLNLVVSSNAAFSY